MAPVRSDIRVHYELEPWQVDTGISGAHTGFALGRPELVAVTIADLVRQYRRGIPTYGHQPTYFVNRVSSIRHAEFGGAAVPVTVAPPQWPESLSLLGAQSEDVPPVGDVAEHFAVVDRYQERIVGTFSSAAEAMAYGAQRASHYRPLGVDHVVVERLSMLRPGHPPQIDAALMVSSRAERLLRNTVPMTDQPGAAGLAE